MKEMRQYVVFVNSEGFTKGHVTVAVLAVRHLHVTKKGLESSYRACLATMRSIMRVAGNSFCYELSTVDVQDSLTRARRLYLRVQQLHGPNRYTTSYLSSQLPTYLQSQL